MPKSKVLSDIDKKKEREDINDYEYTCHTIVAINNIISYELKGKCYQGPPMITSASNTIQPNTEVTPDVVIEAPPITGNGEYSAVNEIKVNIPREDKYWYKYAEQLKKYDDDLTGWKKNKPQQHDLMFTTNQLRTLAFHKYMTKLETEGKIKLSRPFSILHSTPMRQANSFIVIRKDYGKISHPVLDDKLSNGLSVKEMLIVREIDQMKFCDYKPPIVYTMMIIWDHVLKNFLDVAKLRDLKGNKIVPVTVTVQEVKDKLSRFAPESNPSCIEKSWVQEALDGFVEIGVARLIDGKENYEVKFRHHKGMTIDWIFESIDKPEDNSTPSLDTYIR